jgi:hypothetical protein
MQTHTASLRFKSGFAAVASLLCLELTAISQAAKATTFSLDPLLTPSTSAYAQAMPKNKINRNVSIAGNWQSDWGPVVFNEDLTGSWNQRKSAIGQLVGGGVGQILEGNYNPKTRRLIFVYYQPWNQMNGTVTMTLSADGNRLTGTWTQHRGSNLPGLFDSGTWTMIRASQ